MVKLVDEMLALHKQLAKARSNESTREHAPLLTKSEKIIGKQIEITDKKIDALVYKLYGLTKEEIRVVEGETL